MTNNPLNIAVRRSENVTIQVNDVEAYEKLVQGRIADATEELKTAHAERVADLQDQIKWLRDQLTNPENAFREHKARETEIERLLDDVAGASAIGENRIRSALEDFANLKYHEIDTLLQESEERGLMVAARSAFGRGLVAEDAVRWPDAARHYARAADLNATFEMLNKATEFAWRAGQISGAVRYGERLLTVAQDGGDQEHIATALNAFANAVQAQGRFAEAEGLYRQALEIDRATIGEDHPSYATRLNNLAGVVQAQGRFAEAEGLYRQALEIDRATIGEDHPSYAIHLNNLASVVRAQGRFTEAEGLYEQALAIFERTLPADHPHIAVVRDALRAVRDGTPPP